jgi:hypothetical protein
MEADSGNDLELEVRSNVGITRVEVMVIGIAVDTGIVRVPRGVITETVEAPGVSTEFAMRVLITLVIIASTQFKSGAGAEGVW